MCYLFICYVKEIKDYTPVSTRCRLPIGTSLNQTYIQTFTTLQWAYLKTLAHSRYIILSLFAFCLQYQNGYYLILFHSKQCVIITYNNNTSWNVIPHVHNVILNAIEFDTVSNVLYRQYYQSRLYNCFVKTVIHNNI